MVRTPIVKLFYLNGTEVLLGKVNICQTSLVSFSYKYSEKDKDKGFLLFSFNQEIPFSLRLFEPGTFYGVKWGYMSQLSPTRLIAVDAISSSYDSKGYTLRVSFVSKADYISENGGGWNSVEEALADLAIEYEWTDTEGTRRIVRYTRDISTGEPVVTTIDLQPWAKESLVSPSGPEIYGRYGLYGRDGKLVTEAAAARVGETPDNLNKLFEKLFGVTRDSLSDSIKAVLTAFALQFLKGHFVDTRDDALSLKAPNLDATPLFTVDTRPGFKSTFLISINLAKASGTNAGVNVVTTTVDPLSKTTDASIYSGIDLPTKVPGLIKDVEDETIETTYTLVKVNNDFFYKPEGSEKLIPADVEVVKRWAAEYKEWRDTFFPNDRAKQKKGWPFYGPFVAKDLPQDFSPDDPRYNGTRLFSREELAARSAKEYQVEVKKARAVDTVNLVPLTIQRTSAISNTAALNSAQSGLLDLFFNSLQGKVSIEGLPTLTVGFNFNIRGLGDMAAGKYHCTTCSHNIQGGKYLTSFVGGKVPVEYKSNTQKFKQKQEEYIADFLEESKPYVAEEYNASFSVTDMERWYQGSFNNITPMAPIPGLPTINANKDILPGESTAAPGAFIGQVAEE